MAGHSKWANIKHKKAKTDAQKGVSFAKFSKEIIMAAKMGGADLNGNFRLRTAVDKAKAGGLPNDTIKRAIDKGCGKLACENFEEISYEGYAAGGVAVFVEVATDNKNRSAGDIRSYFTKYGGNMGENGCVGFMFEPIGEIFIKDCDFEKLFEDSVEFDPKDVIEQEDCCKVITTVANFQSTLLGLEKCGYKIDNSDLTRVATNNIAITDVAILKKILQLLDKIESHDDVQNVYSNFEADEKLIEEISF